MPDKDRGKLLPGLGFQALDDGPYDEVDVSTRTFLALTAGKVHPTTCTRPSCT